MSSSVAFLVYTLGMAGLFYLDRDKSVRTSKALWLPVMWLWIVCSRPVSHWLGITPATTDADAASQLLEGSPFDAAIFAVLLVAGILVLIRRSSRTRVFLKASWPVLLYFSYCLLSVLWSDFPDVSIKRWIKATGDVVMILIVVTDTEPVAALKRVFSRTGFILLPTSVLLIKYFGDLGRGYDLWAGEAVNTGVTHNKNALGVVALVLSLGALWRVLVLLQDKRQPNRGRHLLAQGTLLLFGIATLVMAHSATSGVSFAAGAVLLIGTGRPGMRRRPAAVHGFILIIAAAAALTVLFSGMKSAANALGRKADLTGRTEIWAGVIPMVPNATLGAGFESFWLGPRVRSVRLAFGGNPLNEAHNGYIEVYLNLGWVGLSLMLLILFDGYRRSIALFRRDPTVGGLMLTYVGTAAMYSITEAGFRMLFPLWIFFLLAVVGAGGSEAGQPCRGYLNGVPHLGSVNPEADEVQTETVVMSSPVNV